MRGWDVGVAFDDEQSIDIQEKNINYFGSSRSDPLSCETETLSIIIKFSSVYGIPLLKQSYRHSF